METSRFITRFIIGFILLGCGYSASYAAVDFTDRKLIDATSIDIRYARMVMNRRTGNFEIGVTLTNISPNPISGPLYFTVDQISSPDVSILNQDDVSIQGVPGFLLDTTVFNPNDSLSLKLEFRNPGRVRFTFTERIYGAVTTDVTPPDISVVNPANGVVVNTTTPTINISFSDPGSGIDTNTFRLVVNGSDVTSSAIVSTTGAVYTPDNPLPGGPLMADTISVAALIVDNAGNAGFVASTFVVTVTRDGPHWREAELVEVDDDVVAVNPQIAMDANGNALAVWRQFDDTSANIWANRYVAGSGWGSAELIEANDAGNASAPRIVMNANGNALVMWVQADDTGSNIWTSRYVADSGWGTAELVVSGNMGNVWPQVALDNNGDALAVWSRSDGTRFDVRASRYVVGSGWGSAELIAVGDEGNPVWPQIALDTDGNGNALVVWSQSDATSRNIRASRYVADSGWGNAELIGAVVGGVFDPQIAMNASGDAVVVWSQSDVTGFHIGTNRYAAGRGWSGAELVGAGVAGVARWPQIAVDADGNALAVWSRLDGARYKVWASRYVADSGWDTAELIETVAAGSAFDPQIAMNANGNALAIWFLLRFDGTGFNVRANRYVVGSGWGNSELVGANTGIARRPQIAVDAEGNALAVWSQPGGRRSHIWANRFE